MENKEVKTAPQVLDSIVPEFHGWNHWLVTHVLEAMEEYANQRTEALQEVNERLKNALIWEHGQGVKYEQTDEIAALEKRLKAYEDYAEMNGLPKF